MLQEAESQPNVVTEEVLSTGSNQTAKQAAQILIDKNIGFVLPTAAQRKNLLVAFAGKNMVVYGKAFDILKITGIVNLDDVSDIERNLGNIMLYEIKSTNRDLDDDFKRYFFALTTAELLVAQSLKNHYRFVFVNTVRKNHLELELTQIFAKARGIYPTRSIQF